MSEQTGITRAIEVLGDEIAKREGSLLFALKQRDEIKKEADALRGENKKLIEKLKQAEADRDAACAYVLKLEKLLEGCKAVYNDLTAGGADECKKS